MRYCKNFKGIAYTDNQTGGHKFSRNRCKMWICPYCWRANQSQWRAVLFKQLPLISDVWSFHTITLPSKLHELKLTAWGIKKNWDRLIKRLKRLYGRFSYVRVIEQHESEELHVHMIASFIIPPDDLKTVYDKVTGKFSYQYSATLKREVFPACGFGNVCSVSNITPENSDNGSVAKAIGYVTKYMTKRDYTLEDTGKEIKLRIIQTSRDIKFKPPKSEEVWLSRFAVYREEIERGEIWVDLQRERKIELSDFVNHYAYPIPEDNLSDS